MAKGSLLLVALVALIVGALIGWLAKPAHKPERQLMGGGDLIKVDKDGKVNKEKAELNKDEKDVAFWVADERTRNLFIEFEQNEPFEGMTQTPDGKRWRVHCEDWTCFSGDIRQDAEGHGKKYKYWQVLENKDGSEKKEVDGWIVIRP